MTGARGSTRRATAAELALLAIAAGIVGALFLSTYWSHHFAFPVGYDAPKYLWRTNVAGAEGVRALAGSAPAPFHVNPDRPGFPVLTSLAAGVTSTSAVSIAIVLPVVAAVAVGLAAGAMARSLLGLPAWAAAVFVVETGASVNVARMAAPAYDDSLLLSAVAVAAAALVLLAAAGRVPLVGAILLVAAGVLIHWIFVGLLAVMVLGVALLALPESLRLRRAGAPWWRTPSARMVEALAGGIALGAAGIAALLSAEPSSPRLPGESFVSKLDLDVPRYGFPLEAPLAAAGAASLFASSRRPTNAPPERRWALWFLLLSALAGGVAVVALRIGVPLPAHRFIAFGLGLPMLVAAGIVFVGALVARGWRRIPRAVMVAAAVLLVLVGTGASVVMAHRAWRSSHPWISAAQYRQAATAGAYLTTTGADGPVVLLIDLGGHSPLSSTALAFHVARAAMPAPVVPRTLVYVGDPDHFLAGSPTLRPDPATFNQASLRSWPSVRAILPRHPVAILMRDSNRAYASVVKAHPDWVVGPGVAVVQGPRAGVAVAAAPSPLGPIRVTALAVGLFALLLAAGLGWAVALVPASVPVQVALAPAVGVAALVLVGTVASVVGLRTSHTASALALVLVVAAGGFVAAYVADRRRHPAAAEPPG